MNMLKEIEWEMTHMLTIIKESLSVILYRQVYLREKEH